LFTISLRSRSRNEIYFQPLKVCVASTNAGLFYFMPIQIFKKFKDVDSEIYLELNVNYEFEKSIVLEIYNNYLEEYSRIFLNKQDIEELIIDLTKLKNQL